MISAMRRRFPAEWEAQDAVLLAWPHADSDWGPVLDQVGPVYLDLTHQISRFQTVVIVVPEADRVTRLLEREGLLSNRVRVFNIPTNDTWTRDFGPLTVLEEGRPRLLDFGFNGWGLKFACDRDNLVSRRLKQCGLFGATALESVGLILEGGSIESDGRGTLLTTAECLLSPNRNPHLDRLGIEQVLLQIFGAKKILWLEHGYLAGDDTDSHIDTLARFAPDGTILYVSCDNPDDEHFPALGKMAAELREFRDVLGHSYRLLPLPWPTPRYDTDGRRLPATYANFLAINDAVLVPTYADPADASALEVIGRSFPGREIIGIDCRPLIEQHGSLHCVTMQIPQGVLK